MSIGSLSPCWDQGGRSWQPFGEGQNGLKTLVRNMQTIPSKINQHRTRLIFIDSGTSHVGLSPGKNHLIYLIISPKNKAPKVKKRAKNLPCARARSLWSKGRWNPYVWGWFWCIIVAGIFSCVREIEIWRNLDFWSNFPLFFCVSILSDVRAISTPQTSLDWPSVTQ